MNGQIAFPGTGRKRKRVPDIDPRLAALLLDRDAWEADGGKLAWQQEQNRRRINRNARMRRRRLLGYQDREAA